MRAEPQILVVEDNPGDARLYEKALLRINPQARLNFVTDGDSAKTLLFGGTQPPDLILLDLNLPRRDGRELLSEIKRDPGLRSVPVIVITASDADTDIALSYAGFASCLLQKPIDLDELLSTLDAAASFWLKVALLPSRR